jgi:hypothetical protein
MSLQKLRNWYWNISLKTCDNNVVSEHIYIYKSKSHQINL